MKDLSHQIWNTKYRWTEGEEPESSVDETWQRLAKAVASVEKRESDVWEKWFYLALKDFHFLPGGRIWAGAGTDKHVTLFNCFVMGKIEDSLDGIFSALKEGALTMQQGGGVGYDFSTLRPKGSVAQNSGTIASGPVSFMKIWNSMCATLLSTGARRGAMMATLRCDHPDILDFVTAKRTSNDLNHFNLSVLVTDQFMEAIEGDQDWALVFEGETHRTLKARQLWDEIMRNTYEHAEPGVIFIDRINRENNLRYCESISATNPCGEIPLPPYGACNLGSLNLSTFVENPFTPEASWDWEGIKMVTGIAVRFLDNVIDLSGFPLNEQGKVERMNRRIGLGITGLGSALMMRGLHYGSEDAREEAGRIMQLICYEAYRTSCQLAKEKGAFALFDKNKYMESPFIQRLPQDIRDQIAESGVRNSHLLAIAPAGTISLLADNISSGIEPVFALSYRRKILDLSGKYNEGEVTDHAVRLWREAHSTDSYPQHFVTAYDLSPDQHIEMQAALQPYVDNSISKTVNVPRDFDYEDFKAIYQQAYRLGLKSCTTYRPNPYTGEILSQNSVPQSPEGCCTVEREND